MRVVFSSDLVREAPLHRLQTQRAALVLIGPRSETLDLEPDNRFGVCAGKKRKISFICDSTTTMWLPGLKGGC